ncbi:MAG: restriction endonuclease subunit S [Nitrospirae bacterium]|nr:restriction endonuclease subunit S [Nitrospirota bacterium]
MNEGIPNKWSHKKLNELGFVGRGKSRHRPRNEPLLYGGQYPFIQTGDIKTANLHISEYSQTYNEKGLAQSKLWKPGTLCITIAANIAETAILKINACFPDSIVGFVADPKTADVRFIKYYIDLTKLQMQNVSKGTTQDNLSLDKLLSFDFIVPPLPTQHKIASILSAYDDIVENNNRRIKILEEMARAIYREWFVNFRFPGHEKVKMVKSELGMIPEGWEVVTLQDVCQRITDGSHYSPKSMSDGLPMASVKDMHDWGFDLNTCRKIGEEDFLKLIRNDCKPLQNDILIAKDGSYLKHVFVVENDMPLVILSSIAILRPNIKVHPHYLSMYLRDPQVKARLKGFVSGVALPRIVLKDFRNFKIMLPSKQLQDRWSDIVDPMVKNCWRLINKNNLLRKTRDLLLPRLISGEIDVEGMEIKTHNKEVDA